MGNPMIRFWTNPTRILRPGAGTGPASTLWEGKPRGWFEVSCYRIVAEPVILEISHDFPVLWIFFWIYIMRLCFFGRYRKATKQNEDSMVNKRGTISLSWIRMFVRTFPRHTKLGVISRCCLTSCTVDCGQDVKQKSGAPLAMSYAEATGGSLWC